MDHPSDVPIFLPCLISPKVALTEVAVIGLIVAILTWKPQLTPFTIVLLILVVLIGLAAIVSQVNDLFRLRMASVKLPILFEEGQALLSKVQVNGATEEDEVALKEWNTLVEAKLRQYLDERRVAQLRFAGQEDTMERYSAYRLYRKLEFLDGLLAGLND